MPHLPGNLPQVRREAGQELGRPKGLPYRRPRRPYPVTALATLYKRGSRYYLNWREGGRQVRFSLGQIDRRAAEAIRAEKEAQLAGLIVPTGPVSAQDVIDAYLAWSKSARPDSWKHTQSILRHFAVPFGPYPAESLSVAQVEAAIASTGLAASSQGKVLRMAKAAFNYAMRAELIQANPMARVKAPQGRTSRAPPWYTPKQMQTLQKAPHGPLWAFMAATGARRGEMAKARRSDVRRGLFYIESTAEGRTKSGKWRSVPLSSGAKAALEGLGEDLLAGGAKDTLSRWFTAEASALGLKGTAHWLRHTFCTHLAQAGVPAHVICKLAGHSSVAVTEIYMHHAPAAGAEAIGRMEQWAKAELSTAKSTKKAQRKR